MDHPSIAHFSKNTPRLPGGVIAVVLCESALHLQVTADHIAQQGASAIVAVGASSTALHHDGLPIIRIAEDPRDCNVPAMISELANALDGRWILWLWNGEFFVFPYCETRTLGDLAEFLDSERRNMIYSYALDLYSDPMPKAHEPPQDCGMHFDRIGYYAFPDQEQTLTVFGALGWRFEEFAPAWMRQIGRASLFRAQRGLVMKPNLHFDEPSFASVSCPWHRNPTAATMSMRRSRRICAHPEFARKRQTLIWHGSTRFEWTSRQLLDLGMIEPGQWF